VWAETYDCDMSAVLSTQREAAARVAASIAGTLAPDRPLVPVSPWNLQNRAGATDIVEGYLKGSPS